MIEVIQVGQPGGSRRGDQGFGQAGSFVVGGLSGPKRGLRLANVAGKRVPSPAWAPERDPFVVVGRGAPGNEAGVVGRASANDPRPRCPRIVAVEAPIVGQRDASSIQQIGRPATVGQRTVVRAGLDDTNGAAWIFAEPRGQHATSGPAAKDEYVRAAIGAGIDGEHLNTSSSDGLRSAAWRPLQGYVRPHSRA